MVRLETVVLIKLCRSITLAVLILFLGFVAAGRLCAMRHFMCTRELVRLHKPFRPRTKIPVSTDEQMRRLIWKPR